MGNIGFGINKPEFKSILHFLAIWPWTIQAQFAQL